MTKEEFDQLVAEQKALGNSEEDIFKVFCGMFIEGEIDRKAFLAIGEALGFELSEECKNMSDEELKASIFVSDDEEEEDDDDDLASYLEEESQQEKLEKKRKNVQLIGMRLSYAAMQKKEFDELRRLISNMNYFIPEGEFEPGVKAKVLFIDADPQSDGYSIYLGHRIYDCTVDPIDNEKILVNYVDNGKPKSLPVDIYSPTVCVYLP